MKRSSSTTRACVRLGLVVSTGVLAACAVPDDGDGTTSSELAPSPRFDGDPSHGAHFAVDVSIYEGALAQAEMDCFWDSGVRHIVVGTQNELVARQQLAMATSRGMTVDAYVYILWDLDPAAQVDEALHRVSGFPVQRLWLDLEDIYHATSLGSAALTKRVQAGLDACRAVPGHGCGIYTGPGFWKTYMSNTTAFANAPLWYALYNHRTSLGDWSAEHFGGWTAPAGKQWAEQPLCAVGEDMDVMQVPGAPTVTPDRSTPPDTGAPPPAPTGLFPEQGMVIDLEVVKLMTELIPRASSYELSLDRWTGTAFVPYFTFRSPVAFKKVSPSVRNAVYRFRARAENAHGWGPWSPYVTFEYGRYTGPRPPAESP